MLFWALIFTKAGKQWCNGPMEQANLRTQVFIYHTLFALEHRSKMTTQPGTGTQTILTLHKPDLQHTGRNACSFKKFFLPEYNPSSPQPWHPLPVYQLLPCREPRSDRSTQLGLRSGQTLQAKPHCMLYPCVGETNPTWSIPPSTFLSNTTHCHPTRSRHGGSRSWLPNYGRNSALPLQPAQWFLYANHTYNNALRKINTPLIHQ